MEYAIGVDLGGTNLRAAAVSRTGQPIQKVDRSTNLPQGRDAVVANIASSIEELRRCCGAEGLAGIGVAVPGFIHMEDGVIANSANLVCLERFPIRDVLEQKLGAKVIFENDANAAALGEKWIGAGQDVDDLVLLTLGTGVGGGIISDGKILHGYLGMAGEFGHTTVVTNGNPCGCGNRGCLEKHASATAVSGMARMMGFGNITSKEAFDLAQGGNERAKAIFRSMGEALGIALATLINIFNFPLYLLSGGAVAAWEQFAPTMFETVETRSFAYRSSNTKIAKATLENEAGLFGAAYLPWMGAAAGSAAGSRK